MEFTRSHKGKFTPWILLSQVVDTFCCSMAPSRWNTTSSALVSYSGSCSALEKLLIQTCLIAKQQTRSWKDTECLLQRDVQVKFTTWCWNAGRMIQIKDLPSPKYLILCRTCQSQDRSSAETSREPLEFCNLDQKMKPESLKNWQAICPTGSWQIPACAVLEWKQFQLQFVAEWRKTSRWHCSVSVQVLSDVLCW